VDSSLCSFSINGRNSSDTLKVGFDWRANIRTITATALIASTADSRDGKEADHDASCFASVFTELQRPFSNSFQSSFSVASSSSFMVCSLLSSAISCLDNRTNVRLAKDPVGSCASDSWHATFFKMSSSVNDFWRTKWSDLGGEGAEDGSLDGADFVEADRCSGFDDLPKGLV
jgi:hypothetical protein